MSGVPDPLIAGYLSGLAGLEQMTVRRLRIVLGDGDATHAWLMVRGDVPPTRAYLGLDGRLRASWRVRLNDVDPVRLAEACHAHGIEALTAADDRFPHQFRVDPDPPAVLFVRGDLSVLAGRRVGMVGTRNATTLGRDIAFAMGRALAVGGVAVVSGLAKGIDGAAHRGTLSGDGRPIGVVGNGLDRPYPAKNGDLWRDVAERGVLMSEWPPGAAPLGYRFPLRNRMIAALSEVVVVVESREKGGSLGTAMCALERQVTVMAVPGSIANRAANGTNLLIRDGAAPVLDVDDVFVELGLQGGRSHAGTYDPRPRPVGPEADVLACVRDAPCTLESVVLGLGLPLGEAAAAVANLGRSGWIRDAGGWLEAVATFESP